METGRNLIETGRNRIETARKRHENSNKSIKTAKNFIELDYTSFIRRLPIIMLEDVSLHESFPVLIWLMISNTKGFKLKIPIFKWLLGIVYHLSTCREKTFYSKTEGEINLNNDDLMMNTLRFRKCYGGMKGDMEMIEYYTYVINVHFHHQ